MKVLIYFFMRYLLAPLLVAMLLIIVNNLSRVKKKLKTKKIIIFLLISGIVFALPSLFGLLRNEFVWGGLVLTSISYLLLGWIFLRFTGTKLFQALGFENYVPAIFIMMLMLIIFSMWIYYLVFSWLSQLPYSGWSMFTVLWSMLPLSLFVSNRYFLQISTPFYQTWRMEDGSFDRNYWDNIDSFNAEQVKVKIKRKHTDADYASFTVRLSDEISLGNWFNWFVEDQNVRFPMDTIESKIDGENIGWIFYTSKWLKVPLFISVLDPEKDRKENKIKPNHTIYVRRTKIQ